MVEAENHLKYTLIRATCLLIDTVVNEHLQFDYFWYNYVFFGF